MLFAIGDIHGYFDKLMALMGHCRTMANAAGDEARFVLLGDYVDRGPDSNKVLTFLASRPDGVQAVRGNHEDMMLHARDDMESRERWLRNGGVETLGSYGALSPGEIPADHLDCIARLPLSIDNGRQLFVHAGIDPDDPDGRDPHILLWTRKHPPDDAILARFVVHGHTPTKDARPDLRPNRLNLDTGAGFGRVLTAAAFNELDALPDFFISHLGEITKPPQPERK